MKLDFKQFSRELSSAVRRPHLPAILGVHFVSTSKTKLVSGPYGRLSIFKVLYRAL
jgi:hypothetical protein